jgi:hypothetical protein
MPCSAAAVANCWRATVFLLSDPGLRPAPKRFPPRGIDFVRLFYSRRVAGWGTPARSAVGIDDRSSPDSEASGRSFRTGVDLTFPMTACPPSLTCTCSTLTNWEPPFLKRRRTSTWATKARSNQAWRGPSRRHFDRCRAPRPDSSELMQSLSQCPHLANLLAQPSTSCNHVGGVAAMLVIAVAGSLRSP